LAESLVLLPMAALALRVAPQWTLRRVNDRLRRGHNEAPDRGRADRIAHMVAAAAQYGPYSASCLPQAVVLQILLHRAGLRGELRYGVKKLHGELQAHCWIELDGEPLIDSPLVAEQFAILEHARACPPER